MAHPCWGRRVGWVVSSTSTKTSSRRSATATPTKPGWRCAAIWNDHATACSKVRCWIFPCRPSPNSRVTKDHLKSTVLLCDELALLYLGTDDIRVRDSQAG